MVAVAADLWPSDLLGDSSPTPVALLRQQGQALGAKTQNFVYGEVDSEAVDEGRQFEHTLVLVAPFIRFRFPLVKITHGLDLYPAEITECKIAKDKWDDGLWTERVVSQGQMELVLKEFFAKERVKNLIRSLNNQSNEIAS